MNNKVIITDNEINQTEWKWMKWMSVEKQPKCTKNEKNE